jgi:hypothetical protein
MILKDLDQLKAEIDAAVHPNGPQGKTTAPGLNAVLKSLATELTARPEVVGAARAGARPGAVPSVAATLAGLQDEQYQQPFLFAVDDANGWTASASLPLAQARALVTGTVASVEIQFADADGIPMALTATYDTTSATLRVSGLNPDGIPFTVRQVGCCAAAPATFASLQGQPTDNAALAAALAAQPGSAPAPALEFVFEAGFADTIGRTLGPRQAGTYASEQRQNVASATYQLNGAVVGLPLTLASADVLQVAISRLNPAQPAVLTLLG